MVHQNSRRWWCEPNAGGMIRLTWIHLHVDCMNWDVLPKLVDIDGVLSTWHRVAMPVIKPQNAYNANPDWWCQFISYSQAIWRGQWCVQSQLYDGRTRVFPTRSRNDLESLTGSVIFIPVGSSSNSTALIPAISPSVTLATSSCQFRNSRSSLLHSLRILSKPTWISFSVQNVFPEAYVEIVRSGLRHLGPLYVP